MRKILLILFLVSVMMVSSIGIASAESILFPYIANNTGNLETLVTVINRAPGILAGQVGQLHYRYLTKAVTGNETPDACAEYDFYKPTTPNDVVTFAVGGGIGSGNALFNDLTVYTAVIPGFNHNQGTPRRGYLMVTTANANADITTADRLDLDGEAVLYDIVNGAMWGYRALLSNQEGAAPGFATVNSYVFGYQAANRDGTNLNAIVWGKDVLSEGATTNANAANARFLQPVGILPPNQFTTAFMVTPLVRVTNAAIAAGDWDMRAAAANQQSRTRISMHDVNGPLGAYDRNENPVSAGAPVEVRCVARVDLTTIHGTVWFGPTGALYTQGGWGLVDLSDPAVNVANQWAAGWAGAAGLSQDYSAFVVKLEYGAITGVGTSMINQGYVLRDYAGIITPVVPVAGDAGDIPTLGANGVTFIGR